MDFIEELRSLSAQITQQKDFATTEEATKVAFVIPFIKILGYNPHDLTEVMPEYTADIGTKQGEKVDYALFKEDKVTMLIECKKYNTELSDNQMSQLARYFSVVPVQIAILTNGVFYHFYTDSEETNIMDSKPFLKFNMLDIQETLVNELKQFTKSEFDLDAVLAAAKELKYTKEIKQIMMEELEAPSEDFVRFFLSKVYNGLKTTEVVQSFTDIVKRAYNKLLNEKINERLHASIERGEATEKGIEVETPNEMNEGNKTEISPPTRLRVTLLDGSIIERESGIDTFLRILEMFGLEKIEVMGLGTFRHPLVKRHTIGESISKERKLDSSGKWTIYTVFSTIKKIKYLNRIQSLSEKQVFSEIVSIDK